MKTHQSRPLVEELQEMHAIALREHGPHARSTRLIDRALADVTLALQRAVGVQPPLLHRRASRMDWPQEGPAP